MDRKKKKRKERRVGRRRRRKDRRERRKEIFLSSIHPRSLKTMTNPVAMSISNTRILVLTPFPT